MRLKYSVVTPTLNSEACVAATIESVRRASCRCEVIVSDGGSSDRTRDIASGLGVTVVSSPRGRGSQLMEGFRLSQGDIIVFLHSDTLLSPDAFQVLDEWFSRDQVQVGKFSLKFDHSHWLLLFYALWARADSFWTSFGDQGIVARRGFIHSIGGFPDWPFLEDVRFFQNARAVTKIHTFPSAVVTSSKRFIQNGPLQQQLKNGVILARYLLGHPVHELSKYYEA